MCGYQDHSLDVIKWTQIRNKSEHILLHLT